MGLIGLFFNANSPERKEIARKMSNKPKKSKYYNEGYEAGEQNKIPPDNPYPEGTPEHDEWLDGLIDASL
jgi:hypothetical protein